MKKLTWYQRLWEYGVNRRTPQSEILSVLRNASVECRHVTGTKLTKLNMDLLTHVGNVAVEITAVSAQGALRLAFACEVEFYYNRKDERKPELLAFIHRPEIGNAMYNGRHWKQEINHQIQEIIEKKITKL